ncbi:MAG: aminoacyl-tRNA hydrolase [Bacteroidetes bacterium]|nr:aminoacyl-tRNA hydrolase [Bacteroidota bacterium]
MKYLLVGLGNIGQEYELTKHNIGFIILDALAGASSFVFKGQRYGDVATGRFKNKQVILLKPNTYMNLSGQAVRYWLQQEKIPLENLLVITDDLALPEGKLRLKGKGSDGGHNGLKNIQTLLNTQQYARLRFGIGSEFSKGQQVNYVLSPWSLAELSSLQPKIEMAAEMSKSFVLSGLTNTMNAYNGKS